MTTRTTRLRSRLIAVAAAGIAALVALPMGASAAGADHGARGHHASRGDRVASSRPNSPNHEYNLSLFSHVNLARLGDARHAYKHNHRVHHIAHSWAEHLASTGYLGHNPNLVAEVTRACPHWTTLGENVGVEGGKSPGRLFSAYMHSPPHRANILDKHYTVLGIATVTVTRNGETTQWNVMDFANHCRS
jgi:uncharacterized protein YkwD